MRSTSQEKSQTEPPPPRESRPTAHQVCPHTTRCADHPGAPSPGRNNGGSPGAGLTVSVHRSPQCKDRLDSRPSGRAGRAAPPPRHPPRSPQQLAPRRGPAPCPLLLFWQKKKPPKLRKPQNKSKQLRENEVNTRNMKDRKCRPAGHRGTSLLLCPAHVAAADLAPGPPTATLASEVKGVSTRQEGLSGGGGTAVRCQEL